MSGHHPFGALRKHMTPARHARNAEATRRTLAGMALHKLRQARERSQQELSRALKVGRPAVTKLERRADMYVSTLRRFIEAMGGELEIVARFADHAVKIKNFADLNEEERV